MNYSEARSFIDEISAKGSELGLTTITNLLAELGNPQNNLKFVHIAGTNGKGSVLAYLYEILQEAGYLVGRYISPTLFSYRERIQLNKAYISKEDFARFASVVRDAMKRMEEKGLALPTVFEVETAISFLYFKEKQCDLVLLETGMGGRLDATNVVKTSVLTILASISLDHMEFLGNTLYEIAWNKAGILKPHVPVVSADADPEARRAIEEEAQTKECETVFVEKDKLLQVQYGLRDQAFSYKEFDRVHISLPGVHQIENAALALEAVRMLRRTGYQISDQNVYDGLKKTAWKGRLTILSEDPVFIIDGAHNPDAARVLQETISLLFPHQKKYYIFGVFSDKEYDKIIRITTKDAEHIFAIQTPDNPRALPADKLVEAVRKYNPNVEAAADIEDAVKRSLELADKEDVIIAFGSLSHLSRIEDAFLKYKK